MSKIGFGGEESPRLQIYSVAKEIKNIFGENALNTSISKGVFNLVQNGEVRDWDHMETLYNNSFEELEIDIFLPHLSKNQKEIQKRQQKYSLRHLKFHLYISKKQGLLLLFAAGIKNGIVLDIGHEITHIVPYYDGHVIDDGVKRMNFGGYYVTKFLLELLLKAGYQLYHFNENAIVNKIKEEYSYIASLEEITQKEEERGDISISYKLPDNTYISIIEERFKCGEILFMIMKC